MMHYPHLYIDGEWVKPNEPREAELIDPTREQAFARVALGNAADVDHAVTAAQRAFNTFSATSVDQRTATRKH
jgi:aldehyde dehydrogenase (NAD+)